LIAGVLCTLAGVFWIFNLSWPKWEIFPGDIKPGAGLLGVMGFWCTEGNYAIWAAGYLGIFLITQWFFLGPRGSWRVRLSAGGRPLRLSILCAALMAALLTVGLLAVLDETTGVWHTLAFAAPSDGVKDSDGLEPLIWPVATALGISWLAWAIIFFVYWRRGNQADPLGGMLRALMGGSILELLIATPVHVLVLRSNDKCYCERGSYTGLVLGGTVLLWTFGPGLVLLFLREKERRTPLLEPEADQK
jgi:hypothetical protein